MERFRPSQFCRELGNIKGHGLAAWWQHGLAGRFGSMVTAWFGAQSGSVVWQDGLAAWFGAQSGSMVWQHGLVA